MYQENIEVEKEDRRLTNKFDEASKYTKEEYFDKILYLNHDIDCDLPEERIILIRFPTLINSIRMEAAVLESRISECEYVDYYLIETFATGKLDRYVRPYKTLNEALYSFLKYMESMIKEDNNIPNFNELDGFKNYITKLRTIAETSPKFRANASKISAKLS
ncbi:hypothetical protein H1P_3250010 [Hyella patelloides LEGE 07179]|uniref:Uncharacterized protein n=1 Tax=Hyella patelloides LEGE 07179 TaxID=945734 RepID=A0A563VV56_9CYAN|nr:hypothetical protein [Hyella patelloides]VEP15322.1 hypothetical protein H1P_3250010 [Hyella patelloides LEGE 07179]